MRLSQLCRLLPVLLVAAVGCAPRSQPTATDLPPQEEAATVITEELSPQPSGPSNESMATPSSTARPTSTDLAPSPTAEAIVTLPVPATAAPTAALPQQPAEEPAASDSSGLQVALSEFEAAAQAAGFGTYTGDRCRVTLDTYTCDCIPDTIVSEFVFFDPNTLRWKLITNNGSQIYDLVRKGVNTWVATTQGVDNIVIHIELIFNAAGFQHTVTTTFPGGEAPTCTMNWVRQ